MFEVKKRVIGKCNYCGDKVYTTDNAVKTESDEQLFHEDCFVKAT